MRCGLPHIATRTKKGGLSGLNLTVLRASLEAALAKKYGPAENARTNHGEEPVFEVGKRYRTKIGFVMTLRSGFPHSEFYGTSPNLKWAVFYPKSGKLFIDSGFNLIPGALPDEPEPPPLGAALARGLREGASPDAPAAGESPATNWQARAEKAEARLERFRKFLERAFQADDTGFNMFFKMAIKRVAEVVGFRVVTAQSPRVEEDK